MAAKRVLDALFSFGSDALGWLLDAAGLGAARSLNRGKRKAAYPAPHCFRWWNASQNSGLPDAF
jgi:hypothetical protein